MAEKTEPTALTTDEIQQGVDTFAPSNADIAARTVWVGETMEAHGQTAKGVFDAVAAHYALQGKPAPRGMRKASVTNAATNYALWGATGVGHTHVKADGATRTYADMIGLIDATRHNHGAKTVKALIRETLDTLATDVKPAARYGAFWDALTALDARTPEETVKTPPVPSIAALKRYVLTAYGEAGALIDAGADGADIAAIVAEHLVAALDTLGE